MEQGRKEVERKRGRRLDEMRRRGDGKFLQSLFSPFFSLFSFSFLSLPSVSPYTNAATGSGRAPAPRRALVRGRRLRRRRHCRGRRRRFGRGEQAGLPREIRPARELHHGAAELPVGLPAQGEGRGGKLKQESHRRALLFSASVFSTASDAPSLQLSSPAREAARAAEKGEEIQLIKGLAVALKC